MSPEIRRRKKTKTRIGRLHRRIAFIRKDFAHKTTRALVGNDEKPQEARVFVFEDLKIENMTKRAKPKEDPDHPGVYLPSGQAAKSGLRGCIDYD
jgi:putative transposase